jgi:hypothetical protein
VGAAALAAAFAFVGPASALLGAGVSQVDRAIQGLRPSPVYVDPRSGTTLSPDQAQQLADQIRSQNAGPIFVVVMPASAAQAVGDDPIALLHEIQGQLNQRGTYAAMIGSRLFTLGTDRPAREAAAKAARHAEGAGDTDAVLSDFVSRIGRGHSRTSSSSPLIWIALLVLAAAAASFVVVRRR